MHAVFSLKVDPCRDLVEIRMEGFFGPEDVAEFVKRRNAAHEQLCSAPNQHVTLVDIRDMSLQAQDTVANFASVLADTQYASKRLAIVVPRSLARIQAQRAAGDREARYFTCPDEALIWLLAGNEVASACMAQTGSGTSTGSLLPTDL